MNALAANLRESGDAAARVRSLSNDALIIELINTLNHLSRWLTPIHDRQVLEFSPRRSEPTVKEILIGMRDTEARTFALMNAIAAETNPDLDRVPRIEPTPRQVAADKAADPLVIMSGFRRVRESSTSLLRALPDTAWARGGYSRTQRNWTIRELAEYLAMHDWEKLLEIDSILARTGAREG
ncbi:MAG: hypothetical protein ACRDJC_26030, partial [Thermomicrobiales bacterium]